MGERKLGGEIVAVHGGHIVRSTGRKDRHSKVCTAKGPRDRRVRLAARTAIQFYDVQDRLGYDRPSKAVDWLINKAKAAIDELEKLPAWDPTAGSDAGIVEDEVGEGRIGISDVSGELIFTVIGGPKSSRARNSSISVDSGAAGGTSRTVFPVDSSIEANSSTAFRFQRFSNPDSKIALQLQNPFLLQNPQQQVLLSGIPLGFDNFAEHCRDAAELNRFQNLPSWNSVTEYASGGYLFNSPPAQQLRGNEQLFSQRGTLQSSFTPSTAAWIDPSMAEISNHQPPPPPPPPLHESSLAVYPPSLHGIGFGGFSGFPIPGRIQGDEEEHQPFSASPNYRSRKAEDTFFFH